MSSEHVILLTLCIFVAAVLYSSVGHAGASGYLAAMALFSVAPAVMKPSALVLNILVATIGTVQFFRARCFVWSVFWPFALTSIPAAFIGGRTPISDATYKRILGVVLLLGAWRLFAAAKQGAPLEPKKMAVPFALAAGVGIGFLAGLTGVGGGIFLSPLLIMTGWATTRQTAGVSVAFILVNSTSGLAGHLSSVRNIPHEAIYWGFAAVLGGFIGSTLGSQRFSEVTMKRVLAVVLIIAGVKLLLT